jgi:protein-S-isoprenylcysteine O-methyltransferase Ste14
MVTVTIFVYFRTKRNRCAVIRLHPLVASVVVIGFTLLVFWRVRVDYSNRGKLTPLSTVLQFLVFLLHALAWYSFVDSGSQRSTGSPLYPLAWGVMVIGLAATLVAMAGLSWGDTVGRSVTGLRQSGIYRFTRNPQLVAYFLFLAGYVLLRPSWWGLVWLALYGFIAQVMVLTEEQHLRRIFGEEYAGYCRRTPRYIGLPKRV